MVDHYTCVAPETRHNHPSAPTPPALAARTCSPYKRAQPLLHTRARRVTRVGAGCSAAPAPHGLVSRYDSSADHTARRLAPLAAAPCHHLRAHVVKLPTHKALSRAQVLHPG